MINKLIGLCRQEETWGWIQKAGYGMASASVSGIVCDLLGSWIIDYTMKTNPINSFLVES